MPPAPRLQAVVFDWAGTTIDHGSRAPAQVFVEIFRRRGIDITQAEAREPMGRAKRDHLAAIAALPRVAAAWRERYGNAPGDVDVQAMYEEFLPLQTEALLRGADVIAGVPDAVAACRRRGLKIGSTTGYTRRMMDLVAPLAARGGYSPDVIICPDDVPAGRPAPWLNFRAAEQLGVYPMHTVVVVDDTPIGIEAGLNAGAWTVAVSRTGNALGLSAEEVAALPTEELHRRLTLIERDFLARGVHFVIPAVSDLIPVLDRIEARQSAPLRTS
jgi:phosphonoacetaldehyde hydrolase